MWPETARERKTRVTTAGVRVTSPRSARSPRRSANRCATTAARRVTWRENAITRTSRSATRAAALDTSKSAATRLNATGVVRSATWPCTASKPPSSAATTAARRATWPRSAPSTRRPSACPLTRSHDRPPSWEYHFGSTFGRSISSAPAGVQANGDSKTVWHLEQGDAFPSSDVRPRLSNEVRSHLEMQASRLMTFPHTSRH